MGDFPRSVCTPPLHPPSGGGGASWPPNLIPGFRSPADGWGLPGLRVPEPTPRDPGSTPGPGDPHTHLSVRFASRARAQVRVGGSGSDRRTRNGSGRRRDAWDHRPAPQPSSGLWQGCLSSRASSPASPAPPRRASQPWGGSRPPPCPIGEIQFAGHAPRGPVAQGVVVVGPRPPGPGWWRGHRQEDAVLRQSPGGRPAPG